jgi:hypothetical protein
MTHHAPPRVGFGLPTGRVASETATTYTERSDAPAPNGFIAVRWGAAGGDPSAGRTIVPGHRSSVGWSCRPGRHGRRRAGVDQPVSAIAAPAQGGFIACLADEVISAHVAAGLRHSGSAFRAPVLRPAEPAQPTRTFHRGSPPTWLPVHGAGGAGVRANRSHLLPSAPRRHHPGDTRAPCETRGPRAAVRASGAAGLGWRPGSRRARFPRTCLTPPYQHGAPPLFERTTVDVTPPSPTNDRRPTRSGRWTTTETPKPPNSPDARPWPGIPVPGDSVRRDLGARRSSRSWTSRAPIAPTAMGRGSVRDRHPHRGQGRIGGIGDPGELGCDSTQPPATCVAPANASTPSGPIKIMCRRPIRLRTPRSLPGEGCT